MITLTIEKPTKMKKNAFVDFDQLFMYLIKENIISYTEMGIINKEDISVKVYELYKQSKKIDKKKFIDVTNK